MLIVTMISRELAPLNRFQLRAPEGDDLWAIFSHDANHLYSGGEGSKIWIWDVKTLQLEGSIDTFDTDALLSADLHPTAELLAVAGRYPSARIWNLDDGHEMGRAQPHRKWATKVRFSDGGRLVASAGMDHVVRISDATTGKRVGRIKRLGSFIHGLAAAQNGELTGVVYLKGVKVWNRNLEEVFQLNGLY